MKRSDSKPTGLGAVTIAMCALNATVFFWTGSASTPLKVAMFSFTAIGYLVLWQFWIGRNWARWLVMFASGVCIANLYYLSTATSIQAAIIIVETLFGIFMLYWLNTAAVRGFFTQRGAAHVA